MCSYGFLIVSAADTCLHQRPIRIRSILISAATLLTLSFIVGDVLRQYLSRTGQLHLGSIPCGTGSFWWGALSTDCGSDCRNRYGRRVPESDDGTLGTNSEYSLALGTLYRCRSVHSCRATTSGTASDRICYCVGKGAFYLSQVFCARIYRFRRRLSEGKYVRGYVV